MPTIQSTMDLERRLAAAREREKVARARAAQLRRSLSKAGRRTETQRLCVLGAALSAWAEASPEVHQAARAFLRDYITRDSDKMALDGTWADVR